MFMRLFPVRRRSNAHTAQVSFMLLFCTVQGLVRWKPTRTCNVALQKRQLCGHAFMSRTGCYALGCCYQLPLFFYAAPACFRMHFDSSRSDISPRQGSVSASQQTTYQGYETNLLLNHFFALLANTPEPPTTRTTATTTTYYWTTTTSKSMRNNLLAFLAKIRRESRTKIPPTITPSPSAYVNTRPVTTEKTSAFIASGVLSEEGPGSRTVLFYRNFSASRNNTNGQSVKRCYFSGQSRRPCGLTINSPGDCVAIGCCWDSSLIQTVQCFQPTSERGLSQHLRPTNESRPVSRDELLSPISETENRYNPIHRNTDNILPEDNLVEPPLPPDFSGRDFSTQFPNPEVVAPVIGSELPGLGFELPSTLPRSSTLTTFHVYEAHTPTWVPHATASGVSPTVAESGITTVGNVAASASSAVTEPLWLRNLVEQFEQRVETSTVGPTRPAAATITSRLIPAIPTQTQDDVGQSYPSPTQAGSQSSSERTSTSTQQPQSLEDIVTFLKLIDDISRKRRIRNPSQTCALKNRDSCCIDNPQAPCCEFQPQRDLAHRAAPMTRIVGGGPAGHLRKAMVYLTRGILQDSFCGGTLIDNRWVLTAAHCVLDYCNGTRPNGDLMVSLGKYQKSPYLRDVGQQDFYVSNVICRNDQCKSEGRPRLNDLALLRLRRPAYSTAYVTPASMPVAYESPQKDRPCIVLGWGLTQGTGYPNILKEVSVPHITNEQCNRPDWRNCVVRGCMMCAGAYKAAPCEGDSGGPLFCQRPNGLYVLHGVYSWGRCGSAQKKPAVYTRVSYFMNWIRGIMESIE